MFTVGQATVENQTMTTKRNPPPSKSAPPDEPAAELEAVRNELTESNARHLRLAADFDNFKKRARQDQVDTIQYASAGIVERLLPVLDDFHRALEHAPEGVDESWLRGVQLTLQKLDELLAAQGVTPIESVGVRFDPKVHEAVSSEESDQPEDTVIAELRRGYRMHDRVLRPALVKLARSSTT